MRCDARSGDQLVTRDEVVIVGYAETPIRHHSGRSAYDLAGEALSALLTTTGIPK